MTDNHDDPVEGTVGLDPAGTLDDQCAHPLPDRRLFDGEVVCSVCWEVLGGPVPAIVPRDRPGTADPTRREGDERSGGLRFVALPTDGQTRPYTPDQVEQEIVLLLDRLERGQGWLTTKEEERAAASLAYDLAFARALINSTARSKEVREAEAMLACRDQYERWKLLDLTCKTTAEGMHNLRSMLVGFMSVAKSIGAELGAYR